VATRPLVTAAPSATGPSRPAPEQGEQRQQDQVEHPAKSAQTDQRQQLDAVGELLALSAGGDCAAVRTLTERRLALVRARLAELRTIEAELDGLAGACREPAARCLAIDRLREAPDGPSASLGRP
jgi:hypothetical protein